MAYIMYKVNYDGWRELILHLYSTGRSLIWCREQPLSDS